jgi:hypothetical protein
MKPLIAAMLILVLTSVGMAENFVVNEEDDGTVTVQGNVSSLDWDKNKEGYYNMVFPLPEIKFSENRTDNEYVIQGNCCSYTKNNNILWCLGLGWETPKIEGNRLVLTPVGKWTIFNRITKDLFGDVTEYCANVCSLIKQS